MRKVTFGVALVAAFMAVGASAGDGVGSGDSVGDGVVRLDSPAALERLRASNPAHYAQAMKIIASANHLCRPTAAQVQKAHTPEKGQTPDASDAFCAASLLRTSNPPKQEVRFSLDHTKYAALVRVTDDPPRLMAATDEH